MKQMGSKVKFIMRYAQEGDDFLDSIVTGGETWDFHHTPESKWWWGARSHDIVQRAGGSFYDWGIQKPIPRLNKCLDNTGDCVEK